MVDVTKIEKLLKKHFDIRGTASVDANTGIVDVQGEVILKDKFKVTRLPVQFGHVTGGFTCWKNTLTTLEGAPHSARDFICESNQLSSLEHAPKKVSGTFRCGRNRLTSLEYAPKGITSFECPSNLLTSLEGAPSQVTGTFNCANNRLTSLEHCPTSVGYEFNCSGNQLTSLIHGPQDVGSAGGPFGGHYLCSHNQLTSLEGAPAHVPGNFVCHENPLKTLEGMPADIGKVFTVGWSDLLPMLRMLDKNVTRMQLVDGPPQVVQILLKHAQQGKAGAIKAAAELSKEGFRGNARW